MISLTVAFESYNPTIPLPDEPILREAQEKKIFAARRKREEAARRGDLFDACPGCNRHARHEPYECPAIQTCYRCLERGHAAKDCNRPRAEGCTKCGSPYHLEKYCYQPKFVLYTTEERVAALEKCEAAKGLPLADGGALYDSELAWCPVCASSGHLLRKCPKLPRDLDPRQIAQYSNDVYTNGRIQFGGPSFKFDFPVRRDPSQPSAPNANANNTPSPNAPSTEERTKSAHSERAPQRSRNKVWHNPNRNRRS